MRGKSDAIEGGWVKSYRKLLEEEFSHCPIKYVVWDFLLLNATHKPHETRLGAKPITLMPGQLITSQPKIRKQFDQKLVKVSLDMVRGALDYFTREGMITTEGTRKGTIVTIVNWAKYQGEIEPKNSDFAPRQVPDTIPRHKNIQEANEYSGLSDIAPDSFPDTNPESFPAIQEDNKYTTEHCSNTSLVPTDVGTTQKKTSTDYPEEFEWIWQKRPRRQGGDSKKKTLQCCNARLKQGSTWREMAEGVRRYHKFCEATGKLNTEYTMQMTRFFGTEEQFKEDWSYEPATTTKQPSSAGQAKLSTVDRQHAAAAIYLAGLECEQGSPADAGAVVATYE
ncbi:MAG: hypothetical protein V7731_24180 [Amphritea sp.]